MRITVETKGGTLELHCRPGEKLLRAALSNGIDLPYDCATGTCGTCKVRLVAGRVATAWPEAPAEGGCSAGQILACQAVALEDCTVSVDRLVCSEPGSPRPTNFSGTLVRRRRVGPEILSFEVETDAEVTFGAGQFMLIEAPHLDGARAYSISSQQDASRRLSFLAKRKPGGRVTEWLFGASNVDDAPVRLFGPLGRAVFDPSIARDLLCIAGGSGIAGMLAIVGRAANAGYFDRFHAEVFFGVRAARDLFALEELAASCRRHPDRVTVTVAVAEGPVPAPVARDHAPVVFEAGLVHEVAVRRMPAGAAPRAFLAGPPAMVDAAIRVLLRHGLPAGNIRFDRFH